MKKTDIRNLYDIIKAEMSGYRLKQDLLVQVPIHNILCGILFESSGFSKEAFNISVFVQPLYVPAERVVVNFGMRLPGVWEYVPSDSRDLAARLLEAFKEQGLPFHRRFATADQFFQEASGAFSPNNIHLQQALVLTAICLGRNREAQDHFKSLQHLVEKMDRKVTWPRAVLSETQAFLDEAAKDSEAARQHLRQVELATLRSLNLHDFPRLLAAT